MKGQADLEWFLMSGESMFERSTTGATLDLLAARAYTSYRCRRKGCAAGILEEVPEGDTTHKVGDWCPRCKGTGVIPARLTATCAKEVTARPTTHDGRSGRSAIEDDRMPRYATVSRRLWRLPARLRAALRLAYGPDGARCHDGPWNRSWAVALLTSAGTDLLVSIRRSRPDLGGQEAHLQLLTEVRRLDLSRSVGRRDPRVHDCMQQAEALLQDAERAWDSVLAEERDA